MRITLEPFAIEVYRRFLEGETIQQLSADLGIPAERIQQRVQAAALYEKREQKGYSPSRVRPGRFQLTLG